ncbi:hypothetical protein V5O48_015324 [Marasmius crinis-equi]|uniref:Uncharacterized protein n=1 Tax=Marasmius crinis-equi TaxID=585013 RepID=A0ABR3EV46_9AGAR
MIAQRAVQDTQVAEDVSCVESETDCSANGSPKRPSLPSNEWIKPRKQLLRAMMRSTRPYKSCLNITHPSVLVASTSGTSQFKVANLGHFGRLLSLFRTKERLNVKRNTSVPPGAAGDDREEVYGTIKG